jgi:hypothetical protein
MSKRLQIVMDDAEIREIKRVARQNRMTVAEWVRQALREARRMEPRSSVDKKLRVVREAARHNYPTGDIPNMLEEIERGYL